MGDIDRPQGLTQTEMAEVLRRAAELDSDHALPVPADRLDPEVVEAAAIEAGLSPTAVRRAMHEVLHPDVSPPDAYPDGGLLPARHLVLAREVAGPADLVEDRIGRFLRRQLFEQKRLFADGSKWARRGGWMSDVRRGVDPGGRFVLKEVSSVHVTVSPDGDRDDLVLVRLALDLTSVRSIHRTWLAGGAVSGVAVLGGAGALVGIDPLAIAALPVAGGLTAGGHYVGRWNARREVEKIHTAVAGLLDRLEHPDRSPASQRGRRSSSRHRHRGGSARPPATSEESE